MIVLAVSAAWVGVVGTVVGGLLGFLTSWLVHRLERNERIAERSRAERKEAYAALLTSAEDSMHLYEKLAKGHFSPAGKEEDRKAAYHFFDETMSPRYRVLKIIGTPKIVKAARGMRRALNAVRHLMVDGPPETMPAKQSSEFNVAHSRYREAREVFIKVAGNDLEHGLSPDWRTRLQRARATRAEW
jgi:hypothetical protein